MGCRGDSCDVNVSQVRVKASGKMRPEVELCLRDYVDLLVKSGRFEDAARVFKEELREKKPE